VRRASAAALRQKIGELADSHNAVLVAHSVGGTEAHVLTALSFGMRAEEFSRTHHLPPAQLAAAVDHLRGRGLLDADGEFTDSTARPGNASRP
jgi:hypothetical protein